MDRRKLLNTLTPPPPLSREEIWCGLIATWSQIPSPNRQPIARAHFCPPLPNAEMIGTPMRLPLPGILLKSLLSERIIKKQMLRGKGSTYPGWLLPPPLPPSHSALAFKLNSAGSVKRRVIKDDLHLYGLAHGCVYGHGCWHARTHREQTGGK